MNGTEGNDVMQGTDAGELLAGKGGNDVLFGYLGDDRLYGGLGDDYVDGGEGYDEIWGRQGNDVLIGGNGYAFITGGTGDDLIVSGQNFSFVGGDAGNDTLVLCHGIADGGAGNDFIAVGEWDDFGWQAINPDGGAQNIYADEDLLGPTVIFGGKGIDAVDMAFRLGVDGMSVIWGDYALGERLSLSIYYEDGTLMADDATTKDWLDTDNDGRLTDADGDGMGIDVSFNGSALTIRVENDAIELSSYLPGAGPADHLDIWA
jgi:Ca2+-binding RTX toxin-like protein